MKYEIGDLVADEDDGDICEIENDAAHPNPEIVGHYLIEEEAKE